MKRILDYAKMNSLEVDQSSDAIHVIFSANPNYEIRITIPFGIHEWFIDLGVKGSDPIIFQDWADHYHLGSDDETDLDEERQDTIIKVMQILNGAELRIRTLKTCRFLKHKILEVKTGSGWVDFWKLT